MSFSIGDRCVDTNRNWPRYRQTGTVVSIDNDNISWKSDIDGEIITDSITDMEKVVGKKFNRGGKFPGGMLVGPSHEKGGIPARIKPTKEIIELEGREYVLNAESTEALGTDFLDKLNK